MKAELGRAFTHAPQLDLDLRTRFQMPVEEFMDSDLTTGMVIVHRLVWDTATMLGARVAGWLTPMSQVDLFALAANAATLNEGRPKGVKPTIPIWPWPEKTEVKRTSPARDVSDEERRRLRAILNQHSAIPASDADGGGS